MTPEDKAWLEEALADPVLRFVLEQLAPYSEDVRTTLRVAAAFDRVRARRARARDLGPPDAPGAPAAP